MTIHTHTPTPWEVGTSRNGLPCVDASTETSSTIEICMVWGTEKDMIVNDECKANAAFIVRACNAHDALVTALESLMRCSDDSSGRWDSYRQAVSALKLARGE